MAVGTRDVLFELGTEELPPRALPELERALAEQVLVIPGKVFSHRDTHFRVSYAVAEDRLRAGLAVLSRLLG